MFFVNFSGVAQGLHRVRQSVHGVAQGLHGVARGLHGVAQGLHGAARGCTGLHGVTCFLLVFACTLTFGLRSAPYARWRPVKLYSGALSTEFSAESPIWSLW